MKKKENIYLDDLSARLKIAVVPIVISIVLIFIFNSIFIKKENAKKYGEKVLATIIDIDEDMNPLHDPYKEDRKIRSLTIKYNYNGTRYSKNIGNSYGHAQIGDTFDLYILEGDPNNIEAIFYTDNLFTNYLILSLLSFVILASIFNFVVTLKEYLLYNKALSSFESVNSNFLKVNYERYFATKKFFIYCTSNEIDGRDRTFKSHPFIGDPTDIIKKYNFNNFDLKYDKNNINKYIIDTNKLDKYIK